MVQIQKKRVVPEVVAGVMMVVVVELTVEVAVQVEVVVRIQRCQGTVAAGKTIAEKTVAVVEKTVAGMMAGSGMA